MTKTQPENISRAADLYAKGKTNRQIAQLMGVTPQTVSAWRSLCKGTEADWQQLRAAHLKSTLSVGSWLDKKISDVMHQIDEASELAETKEKLFTELDKLISMKKKYDSTIDRLGETKRVMEDFIGYLRQNHAEAIPHIKDILQQYLLQVGGR